MARATTAKTSARKSRTATSEAAPKRKPGRPVGSTKAKKAPAATTPSRITKTTAKRGPAAKAAAAAPKMSKSELEAHVSKLERTLSRLRDKNKELKQAATDAREHADTLEEQLTSRPAPPAASKPKPARKPRSKASPPPMPEEEMEPEAVEL